MDRYITKITTLEELDKAFKLFGASAQLKLAQLQFKSKEEYYRGNPEENKGIFLMVSKEHNYVIESCPYHLFKDTYPFISFEDIRKEKQ